MWSGSGLGIRRPLFPFPISAAAKREGIRGRKSATCPREEEPPKRGKSRLLPWLTPGLSQQRLTECWSLEFSEVGILWSEAGLKQICEHVKNQRRIEFQKFSMARGCLCCLKYLMFLFNLMFWLCGCGLLGVGIWLSATQGSFATLAPSLPSLSAANLLIAIGTIVMVVGFLGCLGAIKESKCLLLSFFIVLLIIFFMELILIILFFVYRSEVREYAREDLKMGLRLYQSEGNIGLTNAWNIIQTEYECCGVDNSTDWAGVLGTNAVPDSCCQEYSEDCGEHDSSKWFVPGCYNKIETLLEKQTAVIGSIVMSIVVIQILGMAFSMTLFHQISRSGKKYKA